jgi:threonine 3-dehydrogenase
MIAAHQPSVPSPMVPKIMRAVRANDHGLELRRVPVPQCKANEVLARVKHTGLCGTDLKIAKRDAWARATVAIGRITGHETEAVVVACGSQVTQFSPGDRVAVEGHFSDGTCERCRNGESYICDNVEGLGIERDGAFADYVAVSARNLYRLPDDLPEGWGALFDPAGNAVHAVSKAEVSGKDVLITGMGPIGLNAVQVARAHRAKRIYASERTPLRAALARELGADEVFEPSGDLGDRIKSRFGRLPDSVIECSGNEHAIVSSLSIVRRGGTVIWIGLPCTNVEFPQLDRDILKALNVKTIYGRRIWEDWDAVADLVRTGALRFDRLITRTAPLEDFGEVFEAVGRGKEIKVLFDIGAGST